MKVLTSKPAHINPVYGGYFADPFVWKYKETFYAIGTGALEASGKTIGKIFPVLQSQDLMQWQFASNALVRPENDLGNTFWAPAVAYVAGVFYLYYSVGEEDKNHQLRVARSEAPQGPYEDAGKSLLDTRQCPFAIDPHPFLDDDGQWYLLYARDFLDVCAEARAGTGLAVAPMKSMEELGGPERIILRANQDWQRFQAKRSMYGRVWDWHTLEGPCLTKHEGKYYCFYSGGRWETQHYGVDYAVADRVVGPYSASGSENGPRILKTVSHHVLGPGHNSLTLGPDDETEYIVYHAWDGELKARYLFLDRLVWTPEGPRCEGPTFGPKL